MWQESWRSRSEASREGEDLASPEDLDSLGGETWMGEAPLPDDLELLSELGRSEATAIRHLERSNEELLAELRVAEDADFRAAVEENWAVLQRKYARLAEISERVSLGLLLRSRLSAFERSSGASAGASQGSAREADFEPLPLSAAAAAAAAVAAIAPAAGDDTAATLSRMQTLLRHVKRKASELEDDLMLGDLSGLAITPSWERKAARLHEGSRPTEEPASAAAEGGATAVEALEGGDSAATERSECPLLQDASAADASLVERLGALLRGVRRKATELDEDLVAGSFCGLSLSERPALEAPSGAAEPGAGRRESAIGRPRTRPRTGAGSA